MILKYIINNYPLPTLYFGIANVVANGLVMLRFVPSALVTRCNNFADAFGTVRLFSGFLKTLKMIIPTILLCDRVR